jgi:hypothetical protein
VFAAVFTAVAGEDSAGFFGMNTLIIGLHTRTLVEGSVTVNYQSTACVCARH